MDNYKRAQQYDFLSNIGKRLLDEIYGNRENYIKGQFVEFNKKMFSSNMEVHPLEDYIISYDQNIEDDSIIINLGERVGFNIVYDETQAYTPAEQFHDRCSYTIRFNTSQKIKRIMNMKPEEFRNILSNLGLRLTDEIYNDRLNIDSHMYSRTLIKSYYDIEKAELASIPEDNLTLYDEGIVTNIAKIIQDPNSSGLKDIADELEDEENEINVKVDAVRGEDYNKDLEKRDDDLDDEEFEEDLEEQGLA